MKAMKKVHPNKLLWTIVGVVLSLVLVIGIHIYWIIQSKQPDQHTIVMARVNVKQPIDKEASQNITAWLYAQKGINHVLVNPSSRIILFTYYPLQANANELVGNMKSVFHLSAER